MGLLKQQWQYDTEEPTEPTTRYVVHTIRMGDVEDPDLMVAQPLYDWEKSEAGQWAMKNSNPTPSFHRMVDHLAYGCSYNICVYFTHKQLTYWKLKYE